MISATKMFGPERLKLATMQNQAYTYIAAVSLASADWNCPAGVTIDMVRNDAAGDLGITVRSPMGGADAGAVVAVADKDVVRANVKTITKATTNATGLVVFGWYDDDINPFR